MKPFSFKNFEVAQRADVFRVGTDAVLLGALANVLNARNILEIGTGSGIISLMLAQRNPTAKILGIDIYQNAVELAKENFKNSPYSSRLTAFCRDVKTFEPTVKFDLIISNPPYFEKNDSEKDILARQKIELDFPALIKLSAKMLSPDGLFSVIIPAHFAENFTEICSDNRFFLHRKILIKGIEAAEPKRMVLEFSFSNAATVTEKLTVEKSPRTYSDQYLEITKHFHIFRQKTS